MSRPIDIRDLESRTALVTDKRVSLDADGNLLNTNQPDNSAIGTAASKDVGTGATQIPLNSDLGSASTKDTGTASTNVPLNSDLGNASTKTTGTGLDQIPLNSSLSIPYVFDNIAGFVASNINFAVGKKISTGSTSWRIVSGTSTRGLTLASGLKAIVLNGLWGQDAGVTYDGATDDTSALNLLYSYATSLEVDAQGSTVQTNTKPSVMHSTGRCLLTATVNTGGNLISKGQRTMFFATSGTFSLFSSSNYNTEWMGMQFDHPTGQHIIFSNSIRIESSKLHIHDCEFYYCAPGKHCIETDTSVHYNYPMIASIDNIKSYGSALARLHTNGVYISDSWIAWDTDRCTVPLLECSDPLVLSNITEVPYGSNPLRLPRIMGATGRSLQLTCNEVRFGGEATFTPIVATDIGLAYDSTLDFKGCAMFGGAGFYWAEFYGNLPRRISIREVKGGNDGGFVDTLGVRVATTVDPLDYTHTTLLDIDSDVPAVASKFVITDDRVGTTVPNAAIPADFLFDKTVKIDEAISLKNYDIGNGFSLFLSPYTFTGNASASGVINFMGFGFNQWNFGNPNENVKIKMPSVSPAGGAGVYSCAVYVIPQNGSAVFTAGYEKSTSGAGEIVTNTGLLEVGYNRIAWKFYYNGTDPVDAFFNVSSTASRGNTEIAIGGVTINKGDTVGNFVPVNTTTTEQANKISFGNAAPIDGKWTRGSIVYDNTPFSSQYIGWVCITEGTPGTWKTFGAISA
jgi:hypothetical protein